MAVPVAVPVTGSESVTVAVSGSVSVPVSVSGPRCPVRSRGVDAVVFLPRGMAGGSGALKGTPASGRSLRDP